MSFPGCHLQFQHYLSECQLYLEAVPAMFRLELLENIFSLLFLSTADLLQQHQKDTNQDSLPHTKNTDVEFGAKGKIDETEDSTRERQKGCEGSPTAAHRRHLDLGHFIRGCRGFLVDVTAMEGFLKLLKEGLEGMCVVGQQEGQEAGRALSQEAKAAESLGCSVTADTFGARLQRLSKRTAEAQWRLQIITSNQGSGSGEMPTFTVPPFTHAGQNKSRKSRTTRVSLVKFICRFRKSSPDVSIQLCFHFTGTRQELKSEEEEKTRETYDRKTNLHRETQWRS